MAKMKRGKQVLPNDYHRLADAAGLERQNIYGWQVTRGKTRVRLKNGVIGTITEWFGGFMTLDSKVECHRDDISEVLQY